MSDEQGGKYWFMGFKIEGEEKKKCVEVLFNSKDRVVEKMNIIGNALMPAVDIEQKYQQIDGMSIPQTMKAKVRMQMGEVASYIMLKNIRINIEINDEIFKMR